MPTDELAEFEAIVQATDFDEDTEKRIRLCEYAGRDLDDVDLKHVQLRTDFYLFQLDDLLEAFMHFVSTPYHEDCAADREINDFLMHYMRVISAATVQARQHEMPPEEDNAG